MPDDPELPPNKRVADKITELTNEIRKDFKTGEHPKVRNHKEIDFILKKLAYIMVQIEILNEK